MDEAIEVASRLFDLFAHVIIAVQIEDVGDEIQSVLIVLNLGIKTGQVKAIGKIVFVDFAKVLISSRGDELVYPIRH